MSIVKNCRFVLQKSLVQLFYMHIWAGKFDKIEFCTHLRRLVDLLTSQRLVFVRPTRTGPLLRAWCALQVCAFLVVYSLHSKDAHHTILSTNVNVKLGTITWDLIRSKPPVSRVRSAAESSLSCFAERLAAWFLMSEKRRGNMAHDKRGRVAVCVLQSHRSSDHP